jgi:hypothetical protein
MALKLTKQRRSNRAVSPAISTVIITGIMVALITVALAFASNFLLLRIAESEFSSAQQFMQTLGLQVDDVAWIVGRTETLRYSSKYGGVSFEPALNYTIYVNTTTQSNLKFYTNITGIVCFNMPVSQYSLGDDYFGLIYPSSDDGFLLNETSSPVARVFEVEKLPMADGSFIRVVVAPTIRMLNLSIGSAQYIRLYLPILSQKGSPGNSQSITLTGESIETKTIEGVTGIKIQASFPLNLNGFDGSFFNFSPNPETISLAGGAVLEIYVGGVDVAFGVHA